MTREPLPILEELETVVDEQSEYHAFEQYARPELEPLLIELRESLDRYVYDA